MLVLSRRIGQEIVIDSEIKITVQRITANTVKLGIECPKNRSILRSELIANPPPPEAASP